MRGTGESTGARKRRANRGGGLFALPSVSGRVRKSTLLLLAAFFAGVVGAGDWETLENVRLKEGSYRDGDSFRVEHQGDEYVFRIFYVDAPETSDRYPRRVRGQARYFSISADDALGFGEEAARFSRNFLSGSFTVHTDWSDGWGETTRYRAIIEKDGEDLAAALVRNGLARVSGFVPDDPWPGYDGSVWSYRDRLERLKEEARRAGRGAWGADETTPRQSAGNGGGRATDDPPGGGLPDVNSADPGTLDDLPNIGPVLAERIVELRPFRSLEELNQVPGIGEKTIAGLRGKATAIPPPVRPHTAHYFEENARYYLDRLVRVRVESLEPLDDPAPQGFAVAEAFTVNGGAPGGSIRLFAPAEKMDRALARFATATGPMDVRARLHDYEGEIILVVH